MIPMSKDFDKRIFKKTGEELQQYLLFKKRGSRVENKKGKGSYRRKKVTKSTLAREME
jgi:hypothetical protein